MALHFSFDTGESLFAIRYVNVSSRDHKSIFHLKLTDFIGAAVFDVYYASDIKVGRGLGNNYHNPQRREINIEANEEKCVGLNVVKIAKKNSLLLCGSSDRVKKANHARS